MEPTDAASKDDSAESRPSRPSTEDEKDDGNATSKKAPIRKRTKTGCLTCRKRRIKCDEGRPTCNNCLKSKRQCDGYNQRVIFKDPLGAFASAPYGPIHYPPPSPQALVREQQLSAAQQRSSSQALQIIAPKPPTVGYHQLIGNQFSHVFSGPTGPQPMQFDPGQFGSQPPPPKFTFFPPTTADAFSQSQNQWRPEPSVNLNQIPSASSSKAVQNDTPVAPQQPSNAQAKKGKSLEEVEPLARVIEPEPEAWEYAESEDDASMAESDDEPILSQRDSQLSLHQLGAVMSQRADQPYHIFGTHLRTFSTYAAENLLATYDPTPANSPLNDKQVASVFWHFINVTGPTISLYERHPSDPSPVFQGQPVPKSRQHIWIYTFPVLSLSHPALLQAILAIASLQIAKLQGVPPTASLKHYHLALRRIAKNVARPARRAQLSNLAATLLLAFYEVWNSDHDKWSRHLLGSRWIIKDIPYVEMTKAMMALKLQQRQREMEQSQMDGFGSFPSYDEPGFLHRDWDQIDVPLLSILTGKDLNYDDFGMIPGPMNSYPQSKNFYTEKDMERYEHLSDLFWWHCKMDVYQSILGGTRLFLETDVWTQCPPRAPMGRLDAVWGTYDHLMLLLGRIANFSSRDLARKREALRANGPGGPPPGMFAGMMPASDKVTMPMGFSPPRETTPPADNSQDMDLDTRTAEAYREWNEIRQAFEEIKNHFGPDFEPLGADIYPAAATPFGLAAHYRTYSIAGVWMNYYMGLIVLHRAHPTMPPVAMMAAGLSARTTAPYAMELGRIAAGMEENISHLMAVSTLMGAALIECAFPLFVAGIQYQEAPQRHWLIQRLHDIARLTGWQSARQIAEGCESAWCKTAQMGRGPPYQRSSDLNRGMPNSMIWGNPRRIDRRIREVDGDGGDDSRDQDIDNNNNSSSHNNNNTTNSSRKIVLAKGEKAFYAMGLLAVEQDLERLDLEEGESKAP
ncbi:hypothetical protein F5X99DRAFT_357250 [Biscogniauxia marginata]|nr:hypothetical protein F5X99DRAFT_357250 [Biscogniauxia marginata]